MAKTGEFAGLTDEQSKSLTTYRDNLGYSRDFMTPYFEKGVRMYRLFAGVTPPEIESTFSQVMLWFAHAVVDQELTYAMRSMLTDPNWLQLTANEIEFERTTKTAQKWLKHQMEKKQNFAVHALPAIQSAYMLGNGYRWYKHATVSKTRNVRRPNIGLMGMIDPAQPVITEQVTEEYGCITATNLNYFNAFPSPTGFELNPEDPRSEERLDWFIPMFHPRKSWIETQGKSGLFDKDQVAALFKKYPHGTQIDKDPNGEYKDSILNTEGKWKQFSAPEWIRKLNSDSSKNDNDPKYRCGWMFMAGKWRLVAEDLFLLYDGPELLDAWPIANFKCQQNGNEFLSIGVIEPVEDLIISMIMNFNMRLDYLAGKFHPTKYVPQGLVDALGGDLSRFDTVPYNVIPYPDSFTRYGGVESLISADNGPELTNQAFLEQGQMKEYLEDIISQHGSQNVAQSTATVGSQLISKDVARSMLRALTVDMTGIRESAELTLKFGDKYMQDDQLVRTGAAGLPWELIDFWAITDGYGVEINGARNLAMAEEMFKKQLSVAPLLLQNPKVRGEVEMLRQLATSGSFQNVDTIMNGDAASYQSPAEQLQAQPQETQMPGGVPSLQNEARSTMNRNTVDRSGSLVAAGATGM